MRKILKAVAVSIICLVSSSPVSASLIFDKIRMGEMLLRNNFKPELYIHRGFRIRNVMLALLDKENGTLRTFSYQEKKPTEEDKKTKLKPPKVLALKDGCAIHWTGRDPYGYSPNLTATCQGKSMIVVRLIKARAATAPQCAKWSKFCSWPQEEIIVESYTPPSRDLQTPEILNKGREYLQQKMVNAFALLRGKKIISRMFPGRQLASVGQTHSAFLKALLLAEQMDDAKYFLAKKNGLDALQDAIDEIMAEIGANGEEAMRFRVSRAGACCLTQHMQDTFLRLQYEYPEAGLPQNFFAAMRDHTAAIASTILYWDMNSSQDWKRETRQFCKKDITLLETCWAITYSAKSWRLDALIQKGILRLENGAIILDHAHDKELAGKENRKTILPSETKNYLEKISAIRVLLAFAAN